MAEPAAKRARAGPDLTIKLDDGEFQVHSVILEMASPVFQKMLNSDMQEGSGTSIHLPGKYKAELESFYKSLQLCTMEPLTTQSAAILVKWADEYQVEALKARCEIFLLDQKVDGAALRFAVTYGLKKRARQCLQRMKDNIVQHIDDLQVLIERGCEEHLKEFWPSITRAAGMSASSVSSAMPPAEHLKSMWPFLVQMVHTKQKADKFDAVRGEAIGWLRELSTILAPSQVLKGQNWLSAKLKSAGLIM